MSGTEIQLGAIRLRTCHAMSDTERERMVLSPTLAMRSPVLTQHILVGLQAGANDYVCKVSLRACYAMSGTDLAYAAPTRYQPRQLLVLAHGISPRACYALCGTDCAYAASYRSAQYRSTRLAQYLAMRCAVLTARMLLGPFNRNELLPCIAKQSTIKRAIQVAAYALSSTDKAYAATRVLCDVRY
eukprot:2186673-Rhodomonas_salina.5